MQCVCVCVYKRKKKVCMCVRERVRERVSKKDGKREGERVCVCVCVCVCVSSALASLSQSVHCIVQALFRVTRRPLFPGHVLFSRPKKCVRQGFQKRPGFCFVGYLCFSGSFTN